MDKRRRIIRYSEAFKLKIVEELEKGNLGFAELRKIYDIRGSGTIRYWLKKYGKYHLLNKIVRIEMPEEVERIKKLEKEKLELERALAKTQLKLLLSESELDLYKEEYGLIIKKKEDNE